MCTGTGAGTGGKLTVESGNGLLSMGCLGFADMLARPETSVAGLTCVYVVV